MFKLIFLHEGKKSIHVQVHLHWHRCVISISSPLDNNSIIITCVCVKGVTLAGHSGHPATNRLSTESSGGIPRHGIPFSTGSQRNRREKLRHALFTGSKVPVPILSFSPRYRRYRLLLRSCVSTWTRKIKKEEYIERQGLPRPSGEASGKVTLDETARAKRV